MHAEKHRSDGRTSSSRDVSTLARRLWGGLAFLLVFLLRGPGLAETDVAKPAAGAKAAATDVKPAAAHATATIDLVNTRIRQAWGDKKLEPSKEATDGQWCRRVYLDLIGRIPTIDELQAFLGDRSPDKKAQLVDRLLGDEYSKEFTRHWTTVWTNLLIGRSGGTERRTLTSREGMQEYLRECFDEDRPYDQMVRELITATGSTKPGTPDFNGATNFLAMKLADKGVQATAKTAQIFLGLQVQCTQCHNHPFNEYKQNQFWELNAFFRQTRALRDFEGRDIVGVRLADEGFRGEGGDPSEAELYYELRNGKVKVAYPVFVDGTSLVDVKGGEIGNSGYLEDVNRRQELAKLVVASSYLERAMTNRMWSWFFGYGFTKPIDDMGPHNAPTHPELLDGLSQAFRQSGFRLKSLMRAMVLSEPYGLSSRMTRQNERDDPALGVRPMFSHFYLRQMQAEQLYDSLLVATAADRTGWGSPGEAEERKQRWLGQFVKAFGTDENDEATTFDGTIPQSLMMMNGELVEKATSDEPGSFLYQVATDEKSNTSAKIRQLYLAALARDPNSQEMNLAKRLFLLRNGDTGAALQDIWWALLNSNEFILIH